MATKTRKAKLPSAYLGALVRTAYLPEEIPPVITTDQFSDFAQKHYSELSGQIDKLLNRTTVYDTFTVPRPVVGRRVLALVHPSAQLSLSIVIANNRGSIKKLIKSTTYSLYRTTSSLQKGKAFSGLDFRARDDRKPEILSSCPVILRADISSFFHTIYSHSLPWAVLGKEHVKNLLEKKKTETLRKHWSNDLDRAVQSCQSRETFGIPVGPDTSRVLAEILLSGVHVDPDVSASFTDRPGYRLVDDFFVGFDDYESAYRALGALRRALWKYNLHLNEYKTGVASSASIFDHPWKSEILSVPLAGKDKQKDGILRLVDLALQHSSALSDASPAVWACSRLAGMTELNNNFDTATDAVLRLSRDFPPCMSHAATFLVRHRKRLQQSSKKEAVTRWAHNVIRTHSNSGHDYELSWALIICGAVGIKLALSAFGTDHASLGGVNRSIIGLLREKGLFSAASSQLKTLLEFDPAQINGRYWLPYYESIRRGWISNKSMANVINQDPLFSRLLAGSITFLDSSIFEDEGPAEPLERPTARPVASTTKRGLFARRLLGRTGYEG